MRPLMFVLVASGVVLGCSRRELSGPPELRLGRDECAHCGMLINEDRSPCALLVARDGDRAHLVFDDVGCLLDHTSDHDSLQIVGTYVHDYSTRRWLDAGRAFYLQAEPGRLPTPMASGIAAFAGEEAAASQKTASGGEVLDFARLAEARRVWRKANYGGADPGPHGPVR